jgi:hypothetical protein
MMAGSFARFRRGKDGIGSAAAVLAAFACALSTASGCGDSDRFEHAADPDAETDTRPAADDAGVDAGYDPDGPSEPTDREPRKPPDGARPGDLHIPVGMANRPPSAASVTLSPLDPTTDDDVTADVAGVRDADGDRVDLRFSWSRDGVLDARYDAFKLPASATRRGELWRVTVTPFDATDQGGTVSADVVIGNTAPTITSIARTESEPTSGEPLGVSVVANDPDADRVSVDYVWYVNGAEVATTETLEPGVFERGDSVRVAVTPHDGLSDGETVLSDEFQIENSAPRVSVSLPVDPDWTEEIVCAIDMLDPDGDAVSASIAWFVAGEPFIGQRFRTVFDGDTISLHQPHYLGSHFSCRVHYDDGHGEVGMQEAASVLSRRVEFDENRALGEGEYDYAQADVVVREGVTLTTQGAVKFRVRSLTLEGSIVGRGGGYAPGELNAAGGGPGGGSSHASSGSGGGSHAGLGGRGGYDSGDTPGEGGPIYGSASERAAALGSAGGSGTTRGGAGGGSFWVEAEGAIDIRTGSLIDMRGADADDSFSGSRGGGGGAGGAIVLLGSSIDLAGILDARGGAGASGMSSANDSGGGGGGGYVKLFYRTSLSATGTIEITGGAGGSFGAVAPGQAGGSGEIYNAQIP